LKEKEFHRRFLPDWYGDHSDQDERHYALRIKVAGTSEGVYQKC
jgi:hypothetical protein